MSRDRVVLVRVEGKGRKRVLGSTSDDLIIAAVRAHLLSERRQELAPARRTRPRLQAVPPPDPEQS